MINVFSRLRGEFALKMMLILLCLFALAFSVASSRALVGRDVGVPCARRLGKIGDRFAKTSFINGDGGFALSFIIPRGGSSGGNDNDASSVLDSFKDELASLRKESMEEFKRKIEQDHDEEEEEKERKEEESDDDDDDDDENDDDASSLEVNEEENEEEEEEKKEDDDDDDEVDNNDNNNDNDEEEEEEDEKESSDDTTEESSDDESSDDESSEESSDDDEDKSYITPKPRTSTSTSTTTSTTTGTVPPVQVVEDSRPMSFNKFFQGVIKQVFGGLSGLLLFWIAASLIFG